MVKIFNLTAEASVPFYFVLVLRQNSLIFKTNLMKHLVSILLLVFLTSIFFRAEAQQQHFIYVESEDKQPFAVILNGKVYSSSDYGYVIVPKLADGEYNFTVSFPMNKYPEQNFKCAINKKDAGFKLKNTDGKSWALENMQTQKVLAANTGASTSNDFSNMLSDVVNDSNLANKNFPVNNAKQDTVVAAPTTDTATVAATSNVDTTTVAAATNDTSNKNTGFITDSVAQLQKISETKQDTGTQMVFIDRSSGADTINVFVPSTDTINTNVTASNTNEDSVLNQPQNANETSNKTAENTGTTPTALNESSQQITDTSTHVAGNPFYKAADQSTNTTAATPDNTNAGTVNANTAAVNENLNKPKPTNAVNELCIKMISDNDLDKLKRKMFVQDNDHDMVQAALKYLGNKCITTDQVKELGNIFSSDDGRYSLYDALFKSVYDYGNYANLETQIIDPYYKRRFEAMLR